MNRDGWLLLFLSLSFVDHIKFIIRIHKVFRPKKSRNLRRGCCILCLSICRVLCTAQLKELDVQKDLTYTLIYKRDDSTISVKLYFVDEDWEEIKKPTKQSVTVESGTDNKPTELFPDDLKKGEYEELKIGGSTYELSGANKSGLSVHQVPLRGRCPMLFCHS